METTKTPKAMSTLSLLVFVDHEFQRQDGRVTARDAFWIFVREIGQHFSQVTYLGRVRPEPAAGPYPCESSKRFSLVEIPYYTSLYAPRELLLTLPRVVARAWRAVGESDVVLVGVPHPLATLVAAMARLRGKRRVLLDRQDLLPRVRLRSRGPKRLLALCAAKALILASALQSRRALTFVVGHHLKPRYQRWGATPQNLLISLVDESAVARGRPRTFPAEDPRRLLWVGRVEADKGLDTLLDAFAYLVGRPGFATLQLDLVGTGSDFDALKRRITELRLEDRVTLHGYVSFGPALAELYSRASAYVLPSNESEGFPQVIFESFAAGLPLISTAVAGIPAQLRDGHEALLVPPRQPAALSQAIERVLGDPQLYAQLSRNGYAFVSDHTLEAQVGRFVEALDALI